MRPIPVFDEDECLVRPTLYHRELRGALVKIHFTLRHHVQYDPIARDAVNIFGADIVRVDILVPPFCTI